MWGGCRAAKAASGHPEREWRSRMNDGNRIRVKALLDSLGIPIAAAARVIKVSRPLLSRTLSGSSGVDADSVYMKIERSLPEIVALRSRPFLDLAGANIEVVQVALPPPTRDSVTIKAA